MNPKIALMGVASLAIACQSKTQISNPKPSITEEQIKHENDSLEIIKRTVPSTLSTPKRDSIIRNYRSIYQ